MKRKLALALSALLVSASMLTACGGGNANEKQVAAEGSANAGSNALHVQVGPSPETIDPACNSASDSANMIIHMFEGLMKFDQNNNVVEGLASSFEVSEDGCTYTYHLRDGLKWSDGSDLTADDFVYSWKRIVDPLTAAPYSNLLNVVEGFKEAEAGDIDALQVEAPDKNTFVVHLSAPCIYFNDIAAFATLVPVQQETIEAHGDEWAIDPSYYVSNGPYMLSEFNDGDTIVMTKNPNYYDEKHITFDEIVFHLIEQDNTSYNAYNQDEIQMIKSVPTEELESLKGNPELHTEPIMGTAYVIFNTEKEPFNDARVREALSLAIDRKHLTEDIMMGANSPATNFVGPGVQDCEAGTEFQNVTAEEYGNHFNNEDHEANLEKAKALLAEAGFPGGEGFPHFEYLLNDAGYNKSIAEYLKSAWEDLGIVMDLDTQEWKTVTANRRAQNFDTARGGWVFDWNDPSNLLDLVATGNGNNDGLYSNPEFDAKMEQARTTADRAEHFKALHEAEQIMLNDAAVAPLSYQNDRWLQKENLKGTWHSPYGYWYFMYGTLE